jgi:hypothetical protein
MKRLVSILLLLSMLLSLSGCNGEAKAILGTWTAEINYAAAVNAGIYAADGMEDMGDYFEYEEFMLTTTFTFLEDGTYTVELDAASVFNAVQGIRGHIASGLKDYLADEISKAGLNMSVDVYLAMLGLNWNTLEAQILTDYTIGQIADELNKGSKGLYRVKNGKIYMTATIDEALTDENFDTYTLDGDTLTLLECHCQQEEGFENVTKDIYPIVLKRTTP